MLTSRDNTQTIASAPSSSWSSLLGCEQGCLDRTSASTLSFPFIHLIVNVRWSTFILRRWRRLFEISGRAWLDKIEMSGLWSVQISNCWRGSPSMKLAVFAHAHAIASISSSIIAYLVSAELRNLEPAWTGLQMSSSWSCFRTNPRPLRREASVIKRVCLEGE